MVDMKPFCRCSDFRGPSFYRENPSNAKCISCSRLWNHHMRPWRCGGDCCPGEAFDEDRPYVTSLAACWWKLASKPKKCAMDMSWIFLNRVTQLLSDPVFVALQDGTLRRWCFGLVQWFQGVSFGTARGTSQKYPPSWNRKVVISFMDQ